MIKKIIVTIITLSSFAALPYGEDLSFEKFKDSCTNYTKYGYQEPPTKITISCSNSEYNWEQTDDDEMQAETSRYLKASLISSKNKVSGKEHKIEVAPYDFACPTFKEVLKTLNLELKSSCTEILAFQGNLKDYCLNAVNDTINDNPEIVTVVDTGRVINSCSNRPKNRRTSTHQR
jgi:hypothetical protein